MRLKIKTPTIYIIADVEEDSLERVVQVAQSKKGRHQWVLKLGIRDKISLRQVFEKENPPFLIFYYFQNEELKEEVEAIADEHGIVALNIFDPVLKMIDYSILEGIAKPKEGRRKVKLFEKIEALEFTVKHDDGKKAEDIQKADFVLIGVSRTGKTPISMYLANLGYRTANIPIVYGIDPPRNIFELPLEKVIGLTISPTRLYKLRVHRRDKIGADLAQYTSLESIIREVKYAEEIMRAIRCRIIDVTQKAVEEIADEILKSSMGEE